MAKRSLEKWKTYGNVFDNFTNRNLFKLASQGHFEELKSPIQIGKEANVFSAVTKDGKDVVVKIYRLETVDFKRMYDYIKSDTRYVNLKRARRQIIFAWTQREYRNLLKARDNGITVPTPFTFKDNIIVMEQIGHPSPSKQLKDEYPDEPEKFFNQIIDYITKLWVDAKIVHGDLSQFNILNRKGKPVLIDFSQGMTTDSFIAREYLERDMKNLCNFFRKLGVEKDYREITKNIISKADL